MLLRVLALAVVLGGCEGCAPVLVGQAYPPFYTQFTTCSWGWVEDQIIVTAAHCVNETPGVRHWLFGGTELQLLEANQAGDIAILSPTSPGPWPEGESVFPSEGPPETFAIVCYVSYRGDANCGHVLWVAEHTVAMMMSTRNIIPGDSGAVVRTRDGRFVGVVAEAELITSRFGNAGRAPLERGL
jgi:hypothetical protein